MSNLGGFIICYKVWIFKWLIYKLFYQFRVTIPHLAILMFSIAEMYQCFSVFLLNFSSWAYQLCVSFMKGSRKYTEGILVLWKSS